MLFNSFAFAIFLVIVFVLYWFVFQKQLKLQNTFILISSYLFYGWWDWRFLILIFISSLSDYLIGLYIYKNNSKTIRKTLLILSLAVNLGMLGFFKYYYFFTDTLIQAFASINIHLNESTLKIILPVGISFYTFQTLSYTIDIYRKKLTPTTDIITFFAFVSFFPQLVAGPIERASNLLPQFAIPRNFDLEKAKDGLRQILLGLIKKVVIADTLAISVNQIFNAGSYESISGITLLIGSFLFAIQIYGDFSGYSDIAIGTARLLGFNLMKNFDTPFFSRNIGEFWQKWHISLTSWFRDYLYIPLGGSRVKKWKEIRNILITFIVSGFWHGANWTFIIWGGLNGLYYLPQLLSKNKGKFTLPVAYRKIIPGFKEFLQIILTFFLFSFSLIFFRSESIDRAFQYIYYIVINLRDHIDLNKWNLNITVFGLLMILFLSEWIQRSREHTFEISHLPRSTRWIIYILAIIIFIYYGQFESNQQFIYFQF